MRRLWRLVGLGVLALVLAQGRAAHGGAGGSAPAPNAVHWVCSRDLGAGCNTTLYGVAMVSATDGWAVGAAGTILHWDGVRWDGILSPTLLDLKAIAMVSATDGWAVGDDGVVLRWNGSQWLAQPGFTAEDLGAVALLSPTVGWIGSASAMYVWNGSTWSRDAGGAGANGAELLSPTEGWAAANSQISHWAGGSWSHPYREQVLYVHDLDMVSASDGWAVGSHQTGGETLGIFLRRWNGSAWVEADIDPDTAMNGSLTAITMLSATDGWLFGATGSISRWDGTRWGYVSRPTSQVVWAAAAVGPDDVWAVGAAGTIVHWNGQEWSALHNPTSDEVYRAVDLFAPDDGWIVGNGGSPDASTSLSYHWDGMRWERHPMQVYAPIEAVSMAGADDVWAAGRFGALAHWDGLRWTQYPRIGFYEFRGIDMISATAGWAVGEDGVIARWDGATWSRVPISATADLWAVEMVSPTDGWAGGDTLLRWNGTQWAEIPTPFSVWDLDMVSPIDGWAVGSNATLMHWDGETWAAYAGPIAGDTHFREVVMRSATDGWALSVSYFPTVMQVYHWDGRRWSNMGRLPDAAPVYDLAVVGETDGWMVGYAGIVKRLQPGYRTFLPAMRR